MTHMIKLATDMNDHNYARVLIAEELPTGAVRTEFLEKFNAIRAKHAAYGYMPWELIQERNRLTDELLRHFPVKRARAFAACL